MYLNVLNIFRFNKKKILRKLIYICFWYFFPNIYIPRGIKLCTFRGLKIMILINKKIKLYYSKKAS